MDEIRMRTMPHSVTIITETWLNQNISDAAIELAGCSVYRVDWTKDSGRSRGGGLCIYVNNKWCTAADMVDKHCCPDLEFLTVRCRPFFLPREFMAITIMAVYIPPQAKLALDMLNDSTNKQLMAHPDGVIIVAGDFNHTDLRTVMPKLYKNVNFPTRENSTLDY